MTKNELLSSADWYWAEAIEEEGRHIMWQLAGLLDVPVSPWLLALFLYEEGWDRPFNMVSVLALFKTWMGTQAPSVIQDEPMCGYIRKDGWVATGSGGWYSPKEWEEIQGRVEEARVKEQQLIGDPPSCPGLNEAWESLGCPEADPDLDTSNDEANGIPF